MRQPVADPTFDQGVLVDRLQALLGQAQANLAKSLQATAAAQHDDAVAKAASAKADADSRAAERNLQRNKQTLSRVAVRSYVAGRGGGLEQSLHGNPGPIYQRLSVSRARQNLGEAVHTATTKREAAVKATHTAASAHAHAVDAAQRLQADSQKVADLTRQSADARKRLADLSLLDRAISANQAKELLVAAQQREGIVGFAIAPPVDPRALVAIQFALAQQGKPYLWGGNGPAAFDCSGLIQQAFLRAGVTLPRVASDQQAYTIPVSEEDAKPGDLVFFGTPAHHVGMYLGNGIMINAPYTGTVVRLDQVFRSSISGFGRVVFD